MAAIVEKDVDCGMCIKLAVNKLSVAAIKIIRTEVLFKKSPGMIPLLNVFETSEPKVMAPIRAKSAKSSWDLTRESALLPAAVENDPAKLGAPILREKKKAMAKRINSNIFRSYTLEFYLNLKNVWLSLQN